MKCFVCQKEIIKRIDPSKLRRNKRHFCSRKCYAVQWGLDRTGNKNPKWNPLVHKKCEICNKDFAGHKTRGILPRYCSKKCFAVSRKELFTGENNPRWNGGITAVGDAIRHSPEYIAWRNACGNRDKKKCQLCGTWRKVIVHHIKTFEKYPKLRLEITNGITLCRGCHVKIHRENKGVQDFTNILNDYMPNMNEKCSKDIV